MNFKNSTVEGDGNITLLNYMACRLLSILVIKIMILPFLCQACCRFPFWWWQWSLCYLKRGQWLQPSCWRDRHNVESACWSSSWGLWKRVWGSFSSSKGRQSYSWWWPMRCRMTFCWNKKVKIRLTFHSNLIRTLSTGIWCTLGIEKSSCVLPLIMRNLTLENFKFLRCLNTVTEGNEKEDSSSLIGYSSLIQGIWLVDGKIHNKVTSFPHP